MTLCNQTNSMAGRHVSRQLLICLMLVILLLQFFTSDAFRLWSPQAYGPKEPRAASIRRVLKRFGVPDLPPRNEEEADDKPDTKEKLLRQQKLINEQHLLHLEMNEPKTFGSPLLSSFTSSGMQAVVKFDDTDEKLLRQQKLIDEQHLLHLGMNKPKSFGSPQLASYTSSGTQAVVKFNNTDEKLSRQQKLTEEQHLLHLQMNEKKSPHLASYTDSKAQAYVQSDSSNRLLLRQKLIAEQHLLHLGMSGDTPPPQGQQSDLVPQIFPPTKKVNKLPHQEEFMNIFPASVHEILLPSNQQPSLVPPTCNTAPQTPTQKPLPNPEQAPGQNPEQNPGQGPGQKPGQNPSQNPTQNPNENTTQNPTEDPEEWPLSPEEPSADQPSSGDGSTKPETVTGPSDSGNRSAICYASTDPGRCKGSFKRYYYNVTLDQCDCYFFGGCEDRAASPVSGDTYLGSLEQCLNTCRPGNTLPGPRCGNALRPSLFFLDPKNRDNKTEGAGSWGLEDKIQNPDELPAPA